MKELWLYNTLGGKKEKFQPQNPGFVSMYVCGLTPYDSMHIGHARTFIAFDFLRRWLEHLGMKVVHIQNVTDIDDKIILRAKEKKIMPLELSSFYAQESWGLMKTLGLLPPTHAPKVSNFIPQIIGLIEKIMENGHAYASKSGVYFDISSFPSYGKLSRQNLDKIKAGARVEINEDKRSPEDFALWKFEESPGVTFDSPWGRGRPGWHIECSAMSLYYTNGKTLDIHGGARDLIFPHHENEIAQSEAAGTIPFVRTWVHSGFLTVNGEKMSKSLGNFITVSDALKAWSPDDLRMFFAQAHYRSPIDFSNSALAAAKSTLENIRSCLIIMHGDGCKKASDLAKEADKQLLLDIESKISLFSSHMCDDLDTPLAVSKLIEASKILARAKAEGKCTKDALKSAAIKISNAFAILGFSSIIYREDSTGDLKPKMPQAEIIALISEREEARKRKDFKTADNIRKKLADAGVIVEDTKDGPKWRYA